MKIFSVITVSLLILTGCHGRGHFQTGPAGEDPEPVEIYSTDF